MMGQMRLKRNNLATDSLNRLIKQIKSQNQMKKKKKKRRLKIEKKVFIKRDLLNILAMNLLRQ